MCNPISQNVVRQSLRWMGAPKPIAMSRPGPTIESQSGTIMGQICLMFDREQLFHWALLSDDMEILSLEGNIHCALSNCFASDIQVQPIVHKRGERLQAVVLLCSITARG